MQRPLTMDTDHHDGFDSLFNTFEMAVDSEDGAIEEAWTIRQAIPMWGLADGEFEVETFCVDLETGKEYPASPTDERVREEIDAMTYAAPGVQEQARSHGRFAGYHAGNARCAGLRELLPNDVSYRSPVFGRT